MAPDEGTAELLKFLSMYEQMPTRTERSSSIPRFTVRLFNLTAQRRSRLPLIHLTINAFVFDPSGANLHYKVVLKPSNAKASLLAMADYILEHHEGESGIIYCLSKSQSPSIASSLAATQLCASLALSQLNPSIFVFVILEDTETVAAGLKESSNGKIKTGVYHADVGDDQKHNLHRRWREGKVNVVVATIAFGLGIDKGDGELLLARALRVGSKSVRAKADMSTFAFCRCPVRFVLHHSLSKSLDGYYQVSPLPLPQALLFERLRLTGWGLQTLSGDWSSRTRRQGRLLCAVLSTSGRFEDEWTSVSGTSNISTSSRSVSRAGADLLSPFQDVDATTKMHGASARKMLLFRLDSFLSTFDLAFPDMIAYAQDMTTCRKTCVCTL